MARGKFKVLLARMADEMGKMMTAETRKMMTEQGGAVSPDFENPDGAAGLRRN